MLAVVNESHVLAKESEIRDIVGASNPDFIVEDERCGLLFVYNSLLPEFAQVGMTKNYYIPYARYMKVLASDKLFPNKSSWNFKYFGLGLIPLTYLPSCHPLYDKIDIYQEQIQDMIGVDVFDMPRTSFHGYVKNTSKKDLWIRKEDAMKAFPNVVTSWENARASVIAPEVDMLISRLKF